MKQLNEMNTTEKVQLIEKAYNLMNAENSFRSFLSMGRDAMNAEWFSARGISEKWDVHYTTFFKQFFTEGAKYFIGTLFEEQPIDSFAQALVGRLNGSLTSDELPAPTQQGTKILGQIGRGYEVAEAMEVRSDKKQTSAMFNLMLPLDEMVTSAVNQQIEEMGLLHGIAERIKEEAAKLRPNFIQIGERKPVEIKGTVHASFKKALRNCVRFGQTYIAGPAGTGKTTLAGQIAEALELPYGHISCTAGMSEAHLLGRMDAHGNYLTSEFVTIYENGGVFLFDEIDAADSNTLLIINSALANGHMSVPNRKDKPFAKRHKDFVCIAAANTWGFGSNEYVGRNQMDAATLDRFAGSQLFVDYDTDLEKEISKEFPGVATVIWRIRENVKQNRIRRVVSTRAIINGVIARKDGDSLKEYLNDFTIAWTAEERSKAMAGLLGD